MPDKEVLREIPDPSPQDVFKAISDPSRRKVLKILQRGSRTAGELAEAFDFTKGSLSHHFNILKAANLVRCERRGQQIVYMLNMSVFEETVSMLLDLFGARSQEGKTEESHEAQSR
jgi:ArsR family transcriptional regulator, arsenate/arsenite/antimonite-responsive transcriptional repressor